MLPAVSRLRVEGFKIHLVNVREEPKVAAAAGVHRLPTIVYRRDGEEVSRVSRRLSKERLRDMCRGL